MADETTELKGIRWREALPFVRLLLPFWRPFDYRRLCLTFLAVVGVYVIGRALDAAWNAAGGAVEVGRHGSASDELEAYATLDAARLHAWRTEAAEHRRERARAVVRRILDVQDEAEVDRLARDAARHVRAKHGQADADVLKRIGERERAAASRIHSDAALSAAEKRARRDLVRRSADCLRLAIAGKDPSTTWLDPPAAIRELVDADGELSPTDRNALRIAIVHAVDRAQSIEELRRLAPRGVFASLLRHEGRCFASACRAALAGRWGLSGSAFSPEPSLLGSVGSGLAGAAWVVTHRPLYALVGGVLAAAAFAFAGVAVCRSAAYESARGSSLPWGSLTRFAREKYFSGLGAALILPGVFVGVALMMWLAGVVACIPLIGALLASLLWGLALLGGVALALTLVASVAGFPLLWPTIAVEGSDAGEAMNHAAGWLAQRPWRVIFYSAVVLLYAAVWFTAARALIVLVFKLTHTAVGVGMRWSGAAQMSAVPKLDAMWRMPAWNELPLLPGSGDAPMWGTFWTAPLGGVEPLATPLIALWVFVLVALLAAAAINCFLCAWTEMLFLLRQEIDSIDPGEIYYEAEEDSPGEGEDATSPSGSPAAAGPATGGTSLPVVGGSGAPPGST